MFAKIQITGEIELVTGMHIGGSSAFAAIGAVDSPIIKDIRTKLPIIPGSSLKGKMRSLLAKEFNSNLAEKPDNDAECLTRLFGCAKKDHVKCSRVLISDMLMINEAELRSLGLDSITEVKFENTINRATAVATPRQIERAIRGSIFELDIMYEVVEEQDIIKDMEILAEGFRLVQYDYLGGSGSRGYGKVKFNDVEAKVVVGSVDEKIIQKCNELFKKATV